MIFRRFIRRAFILIGTLGCAAAVLVGYVAVRGAVAFSRLEARPEVPKEEYTPLRFMLLSRSPTTVSARFSLFDGDGREIASFERSWNGSDLEVETVVVPMGSRSLAFPARVFAASGSPRSGTDLFVYYDRGGFPGVFDSLVMDDRTRKEIAAVFLGVKLFGGPVRDIRHLRDAEIGASYALSVRADGLYVHRE
jgi:hypothetical protein